MSARNSIDYYNFSSTSVFPFSFMKLLFDFFPLILFFGAYKFYDIYLATLVAMAASLAQVVFVRIRHGKFETTHLVTLFVILIFGGMTLLFRDDMFIKWKPTIVNWIFALKRKIKQARDGDGHQFEELQTAGKLQFLGVYEARLAALACWSA